MTTAGVIVCYDRAEWDGGSAIAITIDQDEKLKSGRNWLRIHDTCNPLDISMTFSREQLEALYSKIGDYLKGLDFGDNESFEVTGIPFPEKAIDMGL